MAAIKGNQGQSMLSNILTVVLTKRAIRSIDYLVPLIMVEEVMGQKDGIGYV